MLVRDKSASGFDIALLTTDPAATAAQVIERYAARWAIEDAKQVLGCDQARNRVAAAVERTVPFQLACQAIAILSTRRVLADSMSRSPGWPPG